MWYVDLTCSKPYYSAPLILCDCFRPADPCARTVPMRCFCGAQPLQPRACGQGVLVSASALGPLLAPGSSADSKRDAKGESTGAQDAKAKPKMMYAFGCGSTCRMPLDCGKHFCAAPCHMPPCGPCPRTPGLVAHCACERTRWAVNGAAGPAPPASMVAVLEARQSCNDPLPTCHRKVGSSCTRELSKRLDSAECWFSPSVCVRAFCSVASPCPALCIFATPHATTGHVRRAIRVWVWSVNAARQLYRSHAAKLSSSALPCPRLILPPVQRALLRRLRLRHERLLLLRTAKLSVRRP
jgi:hypothetical protein